MSKRNVRSGGTAKIIENALNDSNNRTAFNRILELKDKGYSLQRIADTLTEERIITRRGKVFTKGSVKLLYDRFVKYYDVDKRIFKVGQIRIDSDSLPSLGQLMLKDNDQVVIEPYLKSFKPFQFIDRKIDDFENIIVDILGRIYNSATHDIMIANFVHPNISNEPSFNSFSYFKILEDKIKNNKIKYRRFLQIPSSLWNRINQEKILSEIPLESLVIAIELLPKRILEHIERCYKAKMKGSFNLYIVPKQRTYSTFASIDDDTLIEEEHLTTGKELTYPTNIKIHSAKHLNADDHCYNYIKDKKDSILKILNPKKETDYPVRNVSYNLFNTVTKLVFHCHNEDIEAFKKELHSPKNKLILNSIEVDDWNYKDLYEKIVAILGKLNNQNKLSNNEEAILLEEEKSISRSGSVI